MEKFNWTSFKQWLELELLSIGEYTLNAYQVASAIAILIGGVVLAKLAARGLQGVSQIRSKVTTSQLYTVTRLLGYVIYTVAGFMALSALGITFQNLTLVAGALSVGIGFGLQNIVSNFISGIIILFEKSLRVGDFVELENGLIGEVREIRIRSTLIRTLGNEDILVPNSEFISKQVNNWTLDDDYKRISVPFGVAYGTDPRLVMDSVAAAAVDHPDTVNEPNREPSVLFDSFGDSSLDFRLVVWVQGAQVRRPGGVRSDLLLMIHDVLKENRIEVPFPQRDLHIRSGLPIPAAVGAHSVRE